MAREALSQETALTGSLAVHSHRLKHAHFQGAPQTGRTPKLGCPPNMSMQSKITTPPTPLRTTGEKLKTKHFLI